MLSEAKGIWLGSRVPAADAALDELPGAEEEF
jgi:hypothetical protein